MLLLTVIRKRYGSIILQSSGSWTHCVCQILSDISFTRHIHTPPWGQIHYAAMLTAAIHVEARGTEQVMTRSAVILHNSMCYFISTLKVTAQQWDTSTEVYHSNSLILLLKLTVGEHSIASTKLTSVTAAQWGLLSLLWTMQFSWSQKERDTSTERHSGLNLCGAVALSPAVG